MLADVVSKSSSRTTLSLVNKSPLRATLSRVNEEQAESNDKAEVEEEKAESDDKTKVHAGHDVKEAKEEQDAWCSSAEEAGRD